WCVVVWFVHFMFFSFIFSYFFFFFFFFFSSRRRHTRSDRDWSSDVCSSDLAPTRVSTQPQSRATGSVLITSRPTARSWPSGPTRSEERRVGKECRSRWGPDDEKKKKKRETKREKNRRINESRGWEHESEQVG